MNEHPWFAKYDEGVPKTIDYPKKPLYYFLEESTRKYPDKPCTIFKGAVITYKEMIEVTLSRRLANSITARFNWSYAIHKYENTPALATTDIEGNDIDTAPRNMGWASLDWRPGPRLESELEWIHMGKYYEDPENAHAYPGHDLFNLRTRVALTGRLSAILRVTNLTDTKYAERADYAFGQDRYFVGQPRSFYLSLEANLGSSFSN